MMDLINLINGEIEEQEFLNYYNANITYTILPKGIHGFVFKYYDIYNIYINVSISEYKKKKTLLHELAHITLNQLDQIDNDLFAFKVYDYEKETDNYINYLLNDKK